MAARSHRSRTDRPAHLGYDTLEARDVPAVVTLTPITPDGTRPTVIQNELTVTGTAGDDRIVVGTDGTNLFVLDGTTEIARVPSAQVSRITVNGGAGNDSIRVERLVTQTATLDGGPGVNTLVGGGGPTLFQATGGGRNTVFGAVGTNTVTTDTTPTDVLKVMPTDRVTETVTTRTLTEQTAGSSPTDLVLNLPQATITADEVNTILRRAAAATPSTDAIIAITDRNGRILGVRVEGGVDPAITGDINKLVFAIDGAVAKARTGAFFGNNQAPLTSRTIQNISQTTMTQREIESNPNITDVNSTDRGPGSVAAVGTKNHFPPGTAFTPQVDLFAIERTNRDASVNPGPDRVKGTADDVPYPLILRPGPDGMMGTPDDVRVRSRFNGDPNFIPAGQELFAPDSYGVDSGVMPTAQNRGIGTLPGGIPLYKNNQVVGGIGVFFPGKTGFATEENSSLSSTYNPALPDRSLEAELIAFGAAGGIRAAIGIDFTVPVGDLGGVPLPAGFGLPGGRIDLVGIQLEVFGPGGLIQGRDQLQELGRVLGLGTGNPDTGANQVVAADGNNDGTANDPATLRGGLRVPDGWLITPHDGNGITAAQVTQIVNQGLQQANLTRAAIRLPLGTRARFVFAVADKDGNIVGLYRMPDATIFSIDVAVAKARNVAYYNDPGQLQAVDQLPGVAPGTAFTARTFRYAALPRFPEGIDTSGQFGPFSQYGDGGVDPVTGLQVGPRKAASSFNTVLGYDSFNPATNFRNPNNIMNQNGIVFFPGSSGVYVNNTLRGGFGVSGDGVDQDDVTTAAGILGFGAPEVNRIDQLQVFGVRLPYMKGNRNAEG